MYTISNYSWLDKIHEVYMLNGKYINCIFVQQCNLYHARLKALSSCDLKSYN